MTDPTPLTTIPVWSVVFFVVLAIVTTTLALYLIKTNPPKDDSAFVGIGKEKFSDEELARMNEDERNDCP